MINISSDFDHGNILCKDASDPSDIRLEIEPDGKAAFYQWFYFRVHNAQHQRLVMKIENAGGASFAAGWADYRAVASYDGESWFRVDTDYRDGILTITHAPDQDSVYYAYFAAYPTTRYRRFVDDAKASGRFAHAVLGKTLDGQDIDYFRIGEGARPFWIIARQHPGEDMASWWMEGFFERLADDGDVELEALLRKATLHIVPCMNLDGARRGHLRTNAAGKDLNRAWRNASMEESPEVFLVREKMRECGAAFFLDVHGDEGIPNNFIAGAQGVPSWDETHEKRLRRYSDLLLAHSRDFQTKDGYPIPAAGRANLDIAANYVAETWGCLSMTLEMPFKDANVNPNLIHGWSPDRCRSFAKEHVSVMAAIAGEL